VTDGRRLIIGWLYPRDGEFRAEAERDDDLARLRAMDPRIEIVEANYASLGRPRTVMELRNVNSAIHDGNRGAIERAEVLIAHDVPFGVDALAPQLKWIHALGAGVSQIQAAITDRRDIRITSSAGTNATSVAEFALACLMSHWKRFDQIGKQQRRAMWEGVRTRELSGSRVGLIGAGAIARELIPRLRALGVDVWVLRRTPDPMNDVSRVLGLDQHHEFLGGCDAVIAAVPDAPGTVNLMGVEAFAAMRPGSFFCNVGRGTLVDEDALRHALMTKQLSGAALDVTRKEPLPANDPLWSTPGLQVSPHSASSLDKFFGRVHQLLRNNVARYMSGDALLNEVTTASGSTGMSS